MVSSGLELFFKMFHQDINLEKDVDLGILSNVYSYPSYPWQMFYIFVFLKKAEIKQINFNALFK